jgi:hypothetical protein
VDNQPVAISLIGIMEQAVGAIETVFMVDAIALDVGAQHFTAVFGHAARFHIWEMTAMLSRLERPLFPLRWG